MDNFLKNYNIDLTAAMAADFISAMKEEFPNSEKYFSSSSGFESFTDKIANEELTSKSNRLHNWIAEEGKAKEKDLDVYDQKRNMRSLSYYSSRASRINMFGYWLRTRKGVNHTKIFSSIFGNNKDGYLAYTLYKNYRDEEWEAFLKNYAEKRETLGDKGFEVVAIFLTLDYMAARFETE